MSYLVQILEDQSRDLQIFERFLQRYYPTYALAPQFYLNCSSFKRDTDEKRRGKVGRTIYSKFLSSGSLSLSVAVRKRLDQVFQSPKTSSLYLDTSNPQVFDEAQTEMFMLMEQSLFPQFQTQSLNDGPEDTVRTFSNSHRGSRDMTHIANDISAHLRASCNQVIQKGSSERKCHPEVPSPFTANISTLTKKNLAATLEKRDSVDDVWQRQPSSEETSPYYSTNKPLKPSISAPDSAVSIRENSGPPNHLRNYKTLSYRSLSTKDYKATDPDTMPWAEIQKMAKLNRVEPDGLGQHINHFVERQLDSAMSRQQLNASVHNNLVKSIATLQLDHDQIQESEEDESERILGEHCDRIWQQRNSDSPGSVVNSPPLSRTKHVQKQRHSKNVSGSISADTHGDFGMSGSQQAIWTAQSSVPLGNVTKVDYNAPDGRIHPEILPYSRQKVRHSNNCGLTTDSGVGGSGTSQISSYSYDSMPYKPVEEKKIQSGGRKQPVDVGVQVLYRIGRNGEFFMPVNYLSDKTLKSFKTILPQDLIQGKDVRYFFKESIPSVGTVWKELIHSKDALPVFEGRVIATLEF